MVDGPQTPTAYFAAEEVDRLEEFDAHFKQRQRGSYSRSEEIKAAMDLHREIDELLMDKGVTPDGERERHAIVTQALLDYFREEE